MKFNTLQVNFIGAEDLSKYYLDVYSINPKEQELESEYKSLFKKPNIRTFSFTQDGFFSMFFNLKGKIAVSLGESEAIVSGAKKAKEFGKDISFLNLQKNGQVDLSKLDDSFDFIFISSYIIDTYVKTNLLEIKNLCDAKIVSNITANTNDLNSDLYLLDCYKLCGQAGMGIVLFDEQLDSNLISNKNLLALDLSLKAIKTRKYFSEYKKIFKELFEKYIGDDIYYFVEPSMTLDYTLHLGLKGIKMRELIKSISLDDIFITNGEGCSLGLSKPSRIIQAMGYSEDESRWSLSLDFCEEFEINSIESLVKKIGKKYKQIKVLG